MKNLKIGKKLFVTFGIIIALYLVTAVVSTSSLNRTAAHFDDFYSNSYPVSNTTVEMRRAIQAALKNVSNSVLTSDVQKTQEYINGADEEMQNVSNGIAYMRENFRGDLSVVDKAQSLLDESKQYREQVLSLSGQNRNDEAAKIYSDKYEPIMLQVMDVMTEMDNTTTDLAAENFQTSTKAQNLTMILMLVLSVAILLITIFLAIYIIRSLTRPITEIEAAATNMAEGRLSDINVTYESKDELGVLSDRIRHLSESLQAIISDENYLLGEMANGNFDVKTNAEERYIGDFEAMLTSLRNINNSLSDTLTQINQSADQVASGSEQVSSGAQALSQGATEQASSVEELAATITEISGQINYNADNAKQASSRAEQVGDEMLQSSQKMQEMIEAMANISDSAGEISKIIKTIEDIAFQTNILALNAAVEAARAGSAGKGFAVVADEVRNLATKSSEASKNTAVLIENALQAVENGTTIADETAKTLLAAVEGAKDVTTLVDKISTACDEQAQAIGQVNQGVDQISAVVQTNSATAEESAAASEELSGQSQMLKELVTQFKLKNTNNAWE